MCLAVPGRLAKIADDHGLRVGDVDFSGLNVRVCLELVPQAQLGDFVLVHAGMALQVVDEDEAHKTLTMLREMSMLGEGDQR